MSATFEVVGEHVERDVRGNLSVPAARFCFAPDAITHIFTSYGEDVEPMFERCLSGSTRPGRTPPEPTRPTSARIARPEQRCRIDFSTNRVAVGAICILVSLTQAARPQSAASPWFRHSGPRDGRARRCYSSCWPPPLSLPAQSDSERTHTRAGGRVRVRARPPAPRLCAEQQCDARRSRLARVRRR